MQKKLKYVLYLECVAGIVASLLYKFVFAPLLAARHLEDEISIPILFLCGVTPLFLICLMFRRIRERQHGFWLYVSGILTVVGVLCLVIGWTARCPVCG